VSLRSLRHYRSLPPRKGKYQPFDWTVLPPRSWTLSADRPHCIPFPSSPQVKGKRLGMGPFRRDKFRGREPSIGYLTRKEAAFA